MPPRGRYAEVVPLAADVTMWLDEEATLRPGPAEPSRPAMLIGAALGHADRYVGTAVFTGGSSQRSDTQGLSDARLTTLTDLLDRAGVRVVTDAVHVAGEVKDDTATGVHSWRTSNPATIRYLTFLAEQGVGDLRQRVWDAERAGRRRRQAARR